MTDAPSKYIKALKAALHLFGVSLAAVAVSAACESKSMGTDDTLMVGAFVIVGAVIAWWFNPWGDE